MMTEPAQEISGASKTLTAEQPLEGYCILREIGHGTQGQVYLAERERDHTQVAIKRLDIESVKNWKAYELFHREVQVLERLDVEGVARFWEAIECLDADPPCSYLVQEYIPGRSLNEMLRAGHHFSLDRVYQIVIQLLEILRQLQACDPPVIHRDIKPSNIMLKPLEGDQYKVYLIDFGAVANPQVQSGGSTVAGTFGYMAPEQLMGKPIPASDVYSLAAVIVTMLSGVSPADMPTKDFYLIFEPYLQNMPHALVQTLRQMLEPDTEKRLCDIEQLISTFTSFKDGQYTNVKVAGQNDADYPARLKEVDNYCSTGSIELWQQLSEVMPRNIPLCYQTRIRDILNALEHGLEQTSDHHQSEKSAHLKDDISRSLGKTDKKERINASKQKNKRKRGFPFKLKFNLFLKKRFWVALVSCVLLVVMREQIFDAQFSVISWISLFVIILGCLGWPFDSDNLQYYKTENSEQAPVTPGAALAVIFAFAFVFGIPFSFYNDFHFNILDNSQYYIIWHVVAVILCIVIGAFGLSLFVAIARFIFPNDSGQNNVYHYERNQAEIDALHAIRAKKTQYKSFENLMRFGRKTIATIVSVEYIPATDEDIRYLSHLAKRCNYYVKNDPVFILKYKFNPPDDESEFDLIHEICMRTEPNEGCVPGGSLPILYRIYRDDNGEHVDSMPFPLPLEQLETSVDVMYVGK
ncbi:MAG: serine/threonine protein kinase [Proteobacteria bacterium]|nr:serine/threonine protein kinase [Pseudomonadota bacterium]